MKRALETNKAAIKENPNYWPAIGNMGAAYEFLGNLADAAYWDIKSDQLNPTGGFGYSLLARVYLLLLDYQTAEKTLNIALNLQPDLLIAYEVYSKLHFNQGDYQQAIKDCEKILSITPDDSPALLFMSLAYINLGNLNKAEEVLNKMPSNSFYQINADVYLTYLNKKKGNLSETKNLIQTIKKRLEIKFSEGDEFNQDVLNMFLIEIVKGNKPEAYKWLNKAVDMGFRDFVGLLKNPVTEDIRNEKPFQDIIQKMKDKIKEQQNLLAKTFTTN